MTTIQHHETLPIIQAGTPIEQATGVLILLHGRGGSAEDMIGLGRALTIDRLALLAPQAPGHTWYPYSFLAPRQQNEPYLSSALKQVEAALAKATSAGLAISRVALCGFSQGACLATELVARHPQRYAGAPGFHRWLDRSFGRADLSHGRSSGYTGPAEFRRSRSSCSLEASPAIGRTAHQYWWTGHVATVSR